MRTAINWTPIQEEYCDTGASFAELGRKYGVKRKTIATRAARHRWKALRLAGLDNEPASEPDPHQAAPPKNPLHATADLFTQAAQAEAPDSAEELAAQGDKTPESAKDSAAQGDKAPDSAEEFAAQGDEAPESAKDPAAQGDEALARAYLWEAAAHMGYVLQRIFRDEDQFFRYLVKEKGGDGTALQECICQKADTKAIRDMANVLKTLTASVRDLSGAEPAEKTPAGGVILLGAAEEGESDRELLEEETADDHEELEPE